MRLLDCFSGPVSYVAYSMSRLSESHPPFDVFRREIELLLENAQRLAKEAGFAEPDFDSAKFAVCAWVDEVILLSSWSEKESWKDRQLQREYYHTTNAGVEFFERLGRLGEDGGRVMEVYCACLVLGFSGRYFAVRSLEDLDKVGDQALARILDIGSNPYISEEARFFPGSYISEREKARRRVDWSVVPFAVGVAAAAAGSAAAAFIVFSGILDKMAGGIL